MELITPRFKFKPEKMVTLSVETPSTNLIKQLKNGIEAGSLNDPFVLIKLLFKELAIKLNGQEKSISRLIDKDVKLITQNDAERFAKEFLIFHSRMFFNEQDLEKNSFRKSSTKNKQINYDAFFEKLFDDKKIDTFSECLFRSIRELLDIQSNINLKASSAERLELSSDPSQSIKELMEEHKNELIGSSTSEVVTGIKVKDFLVNQKNKQESDMFSDKTNELFKRVQSIGENLSESNLVEDINCEKPETLEFQPPHLDPLLFQPPENPMAKTNDHLSKIAEHSINNSKLMKSQFQATKSMAEDASLSSIISNRWNKFMFLIALFSAVIALFSAIMTSYIAKVSLDSSEESSASLEKLVVEQNNLIKQQTSRNEELMEQLIKLSSQTNPTLDRSKTNYPNEKVGSPEQHKLKKVD